MKALAALEGPERARLLAKLPVPAFRAIDEEWEWQAHGGQCEPEGAWRVWMMVAGRGFGKTRAGAEWVLARAREHPGSRIALVGGNLDEVAKVMVEGESGISGAVRTDEVLKWRPSRGELRFPSGAIAQAWSGANPAKLRGPQHDFAWCDEIAKWRHPEESWHNLQLGLRLGERPRVVVTTTPGAAAVLGAIVAQQGTVVTRGRMDENLHLPAAYREAMTGLYGGTRRGRQELDGEVFEDVEGALWTRDSMEACRVPRPDPSPDGKGLYRRVVVGVDPPASAMGDACGIVVCGLGNDGIGYVLADCTVAGQRPEGWARAVVRAAEAWGADRVVAEDNNGGEMVESVLRGVSPGLPVKRVHASRGKIARAEPVAAGFETGHCRLAGRFPGLEDELAYMTSEGFRGPGSPDRADAMVWALTELVVKARPEPRIRDFAPSPLSPWWRGG